MHGVECYRFFLGVGAAFDSAGFVGPSGGHCFGESAQPPYRIRLTETEIKVDIGERTLSLVAMALKENRPHAQHINCLRQQFVWRRGVGPVPQRLELLKNISGVGVGDRLGSNAKVQTLRSVRRIFETWQLPDDIEQFLLSQSHQGPAQQRAER